MKNIEAFTGRAQAYSIARPEYPDTAIEYICSLVPTDAVFADVGAGTGKFTECIAKHGHKIFAVESNEIFDRDSVDGYLRSELVTVIYSERV